MYIISLPFDELFARWGSDDLFYFSQIAGNVIQGNGFTFDGINYTNGFQPLFLFCLIPFGKLMFNYPEIALRLTLIVVSVFTILAGIQFKKLINQIQKNSSLGITAMAVFILHPKILSVTFNGTEACLSFLFIILSLRAILWVIRGKKLILSSFIFAGLVLTRFDFSVLFALILLFGIIKKAKIKHLIVVSILPALVYGGWLLLNYIYYTNIIPGSGIAKQIHSEVIPISFVNQLLSGYHTVLMSESKLSITTLILSFLGILFAVKNQNKAVKSILFFLFISGTVTLISPILSIGGYRDWYLTPLFLFIVLLSANGIVYIYKISTKLKILLAIIPFILWIEADFSKRKMNGYETILACENFKPIIHKKSVIGSFNAGIINCSLGKGFSVINIDGVVNNSIHKNLKNKTLNTYFTENNITYLLDQESSIRFFLENFSEEINLTLVDKHNYQYGDISLFKIN